MEPSSPSEQRAAVLAEFTTAMATAWRAPLERALEAVGAEHGQTLAALRTEQKRLAERLAQIMRRLRQFESEKQWSNVVADAAQLASKRAIVFSINADKMRFQAARGFEGMELPEVPLQQAAAFQAAATSAEPAVALKTARELSAALVAYVGEDAATRIVVYPITTRERVAALVYAEDADGALLDVVVTAAGAVLDGQMGRAPAASLLSITPAAGKPFITRDEEERHSRAQRFARVQVAEIRLYHSQAVKLGRTDSNLYRALKSQIDEVRQVYLEQYLKNAPNMTDYLHQEILRTLANGNSELLGPDYPGQLV